MTSANSLSEQMSCRPVVSGLKKNIYVLTLKVMYCSPYSPGYVSTVQPTYMVRSKQVASPLPLQTSAYLRK
jgi:hypothetical protein